MTAAEPLPSWRDGPAKQAILDFVAAAGDRFELHERIAVFDNDGTLWCEKPMPIELGFILQRLAAMAERDESLRERQPWQAAYAHDYAWLGDAITEHYRGDDGKVKLLIAGLVQAFAGWSVDEYCEAADGYLRGGRHPTLDRPLVGCGYRPMIELLDLIAANGFTSYIASGGDRDFMRPVTRELYGIPPERVIGSSNGLRYQEGDGGGSIVYLAEPDFFDDGPTKPVRIWSRIGARPVLAVGNSNGDVPMLEFCGGGRGALCLLIDHDDAKREFAYTAGAEQSLERAAARGWTTVSIRDDWAAVFD